MKKKKPEGYYKGLRRKENLTIEEVKDVLFEPEDKKAMVVINGDKIKGNSQRFQTFFTKGLKCACCGIEGKYFGKEKDFNAARYHLNLYALDESGNEVLMTKDHIVPRSKGGASELYNYQTMCVKCNIAKGSN